MHWRQSSTFHIQAAQRSLELLSFLFFSSKFTLMTLSISEFNARNIEILQSSSIFPSPFFLSFQFYRSTSRFNSISSDHFPSRLEIKKIYLSTLVCAMFLEIRFLAHACLRCGRIRTKMAFAVGSGKPLTKRIDWRSLFWHFLITIQVSHEKLRSKMRNDKPKTKSKVQRICDGGRRRANKNREIRFPQNFLGWNERCWFGAGSREHVV